jgi:hypothetical protein
MTASTRGGAGDAGEAGDIERKLGLETAGTAAGRADGHVMAGG